MLRDKPAMPVYDPGEALAEPNRDAAPRRTGDSPFE